MAWKGRIREGRGRGERFADVDLSPKIEASDKKAAEVKEVKMKNERSL